MGPWGGIRCQGMGHCQGGSHCQGDAQDQGDVRAQGDEQAPHGGLGHWTAEPHGAQTA